MRARLTGSLCAVLLLAVLATGAEAKKFRYAGGPKVPGDTTLTVANTYLEPVVSGRGPRVPYTNLQLAQMVADSAAVRALVRAPLESGMHVVLAPARSHPLSFVLEHAMLKALAARGVEVVVRHEPVSDDTLRALFDILKWGPTSANCSPARFLFLRTKEAADFLSLSARTLEKHRTYGTGPAYRKLGGRVVYSIDDLEAWAARGAVTLHTQKYALDDFATAIATARADLNALEAGKAAREQAKKNYYDLIRTAGFPNKPDGSVMKYRAAIKVGVVFEGDAEVPSSYQSSMVAFVFIEASPLGAAPSTSWTLRIFTG